MLSKSDYMQITLVCPHRTTHANIT